MASPDVRRAAVASRFYRSLGFNPVPSRRTGRKAPVVPFAAYWETPGPDWWLDRATGNVQVMTGVRWGLAVLDLDGPTAIEVLRSWGLYRDLPPTWEVARDPTLGRHLWFTLPPGQAACPSRPVWRLEGAQHEAIEILGDRKLAVAPPSRHVVTGQRYRFLPGRSPREFSRPTLIPAWLLALPDCRPRPEPRPPIPTPVPMPRRGPGRRHHSRDVLAAIPDKAAVAASLGLRLVGEPNPAGWIKCHALGREDRTPSAGFNQITGYYAEPFVERLSLFEVAARLGRHADWADARDALGDRFRVAPSSFSRTNP